MYRGADVARPRPAAVLFHPAPDHEFISAFNSAKVETVALGVGGPDPMATGAAVEDKDHGPLPKALFARDCT